MAQTATAMFWSSPTATGQPLASLAGGNAEANGISDSGIAAGTSFDGGVTSAVVWNVAAATPSAALRLPPLAGDVDARALAISDETVAGTVWVVGESGPDARDFDSLTAVRWSVWVDANGDLQSSAAESLGSLAGGSSVAIGVNVHGDACGTSEYFTPFLKYDGIPMLELETPRRAGSAAANGVAATGATVGVVRFDNSQDPLFIDSRAWLWENGESIDLNKQVRLGRSEQLEQATAIGNGGHITGTGVFLNASTGNYSDLPYILIP